MDSTLTNLRRSKTISCTFRRWCKNNIEGIQKQIKKCATKHSASKSKPSLRNTDSRSFYKKFEESDDGGKYTPKSKSSKKHPEMSKSFSRPKMKDRVSLPKKHVGSDLENNVSMIEPKIDLNNGDSTLRSRSSMIPRMRRDERKQSSEMNNRKNIITKNRLITNKQGSMNNYHNRGNKNYTDSTTNETNTNVTKKKSSISRFEPSGRSDNMLTNYMSNHSTNYLTQLKCC